MRPKIKVKSPTTSATILITTGINLNMFGIELLASRIAIYSGILLILLLGVIGLLKAYIESLIK